MRLIFHYPTPLSAMRLKLTMRFSTAFLPRLLSIFPFSHVNN